MSSKVKNWLQKFWSNMKTKLGLHNESDVVRLLGERVLEGKLPKGKLTGAEVKYQTATPRDIMSRIKASKLEDRVESKIKNKIRKDIFATTNLKGKLHKFTTEDLQRYEKLLEDAISGSKNPSVERSTIPEINDKYHVSPEASSQILKLLSLIHI